MPTDAQISEEARPVALITGATRRIGAALAEALAEQGWDLALHYRSDAEATEALAERLRGFGIDARCFSADLARPAARSWLVPAVFDTFGRLDALILNASLFEYDTLFDLSEDKLNRHFSVNVAAPLVMARDFVNRAARGASLVAILDQKVVNPNPDFFSYTVSRAALHGMIKPLAQAAATRGVRVNAIAPGLTLPSAAHPNADFESGRKATPLGLSSTTEDLAFALLYLLHTPSVTGQTLVVDGGESLTGRPRDIDFDVTKY